MYTLCAVNENVVSSRYKYFYLLTILFPLCLFVFTQKILLLNNNTHHYKLDKGGKVCHHQTSMYVMMLLL